MVGAIGLADLLARGSRTGSVCAFDLDNPRVEVGLDADRVMQSGSAFKIAVALEVYCQASAGELDLYNRLCFAAERAPVQDGTIAQALDLMLRLSDNIAADALIHHVTRERIMSRLGSFGLSHTTVPHDVPAEIADITRRLDALAQGVGSAGWEALALVAQSGGGKQVTGQLAKVSVDERALPHNQMGPTTTARELATRYRLIWQDQAGPADACAAVRAASSHQQLQRLALGFDTASGITVSGKGGRIPGIVLNDAGVITYPDGHRYAVAVLTRARHAFDGESRAYALIGTIAATAIAELREG